ncbi:MAG TPA: hypothetical protein DCO66_01945 [Bifidobacterium sp.]|nr:hypothetical protein [Bifidobacterium sp.]
MTMGLFDFAKNSLGDALSGFGSLAQEHLEGIVPDAQQAIDSVSNVLDETTGVGDQAADTLSGFEGLAESAETLGGETLGQVSEAMPQAGEALDQFVSDAGLTLNGTADNLAEQLGGLENLGGLGDIANHLFGDR